MGCRLRVSLQEHFEGGGHDRADTSAFVSGEERLEAASEAFLPREKAEGHGIPDVHFWKLVSRRVSDVRRRLKDDEDTTLLLFDDGLEWMGRANTPDNLHRSHCKEEGGDTTGTDHRQRHDGSAYSAGNPVLRLLHVIRRYIPPCRNARATSRTPKSNLDCC